MSKFEPYFVNDSVVIPEYVKNLSKEKLEKEISELEQQAKKKKQKQLQNT